MYLKILNLKKGHTPMFEEFPDFFHKDSWVCLSLLKLNTPEISEGCEN